jgi:hypothetical protein
VVTVKGPTDTTAKSTGIGAGRSKNHDAKTALANAKMIANRRTILLTSHLRQWFFQQQVIHDF